MYFDDLKLGMEVNTAPAIIEKEKMIAFARDYDNIPLHTDEEYAKTTPFGKLIAPGVMCRPELGASCRQGGTDASAQGGRIFPLLYG